MQQSGWAGQGLRRRGPFWAERISSSAFIPSQREWRCAGIFLSTSMQVPLTIELLLAYVLGHRFSNKTLKPAIALGCLANGSGRHIFTNIRQQVQCQAGQRHGGALLLAKGGHGGGARPQGARQSCSDLSHRKPGP